MKILTRETESFENTWETRLIVTMHPLRPLSINGPLTLSAHPAPRRIELREIPGPAPEGICPLFLGHGQ